MFSSKLTAFQNKTYTYLEENPNLQHQQCQICNIWQPRKICVCSVAKLRLIFGQWTVACQSPLSMGFSRHKYWSGLPCPPPGDLPDPGIKPTFLTCPALGGFFTTNATGKAHVIPYHNISCILHSSLSSIGCKLPENSVYF